MRCFARAIGRILFLVSLLTLIIPSGLVEAHIDTTREDRLLKNALDYIEKNRKGTAQIQLIDSTTRTAVSGTEVQYQQTTHDFVFGTHYGADPEKMQQLGLEWSGLVELERDRTNQRSLRFQQT